ncbi:MAG: tetratricopeptide repeat protein [Telluria sp.]
MKIIATLLLALLAGCASVDRHTPAESLFADQAFGAPATPVATDQLFALTPAMRAYMHSPRFRQRLQDKGSIHGLLQALYEKGELQLEYDSSMTRTAAQTFEARAGNCLSLVIMTAAFAKELGMVVRFQSVDVEQTWSRSASLYLVSSHVNLALGSRPVIDMLHTGEPDQLTTIDFLPPPEAARFHTRPLTEQDVVTLYMNNRAAESLVMGRIDDAYWWARAAVARPEAPAVAFNTLGVVYQQHGDLALAERVYRAALEHDGDNLVVMQNLVPVLAANGKAAESVALAARIARLDPHPPFQYFDEGMRAFRSGDFAKAKDLFAREVERAPYNDEFHFWLAVACLRLGEPQAAREQLTLAMESSTRPDSRERYAAKLVHLHNQVPGAAQN